MRNVAVTPDHVVRLRADVKVVLREIRLRAHWGSTPAGRARTRRLLLLLRTRGIGPFARELKAIATRVTAATRNRLPALSELNEVLATYVTMQREKPDALTPVHLRTAERTPALVIIPVFNSVHLVERLIDDLGPQLSMAHRVLLVNDASTETHAKTRLQTLADTRPHIDVLHLPNNCGFPEAANEGMRRSNGSHVILLNSDTRVPRDFISRMLEPLLIDPTIASVTSMSNDATIASIPSVSAGTALPDSIRCADVDAVADRLWRSWRGSDNPYFPQVPTCIGFACAIRWDAIDDVGLFDSATFGRGYGEENDWSLRASRRGWRHVLHPGIFVQHIHGASYGIERDELLADHLTLINDRYPEYAGLVNEFINTDPLRFFRVAVAMLSSQEAGKAVRLTVDHGAGGGSSIFSSSRPINAADVSLLWANGSGTSMVLAAHTWGRQMEFSVSGSDDLTDLTSLLPPTDVILGSLPVLDSSGSLQLLRQVASLVDALPESSRKRVEIHDFFLVCPSYNLLDHNGRYCGVPLTLETCHTCWGSNPLIQTSRHGQTVSDWRQVAHTIFESANRLTFFSPSSVELLERGFPDTQFPPVEVVDPFLTLPPLGHSTRSGERPKLPTVLALGNINEAKGAQVLISLAKSADRRGSRLSVELLGRLSEPPPDGLIDHGSYQRQHLVEHLSRINPDLVLIPSIWPETYCFAAEEAWQLGYHIVAFDVGALGDRFRSRDRATLMPLGEDVDLEETLHSLIINLRMTQNEND